MEPIETPAARGASDPREHWNRIYAGKSDGELSWFQSRPERALSMIGQLSPRPRRAIDVGGGQSSLALELLSAGIPHVTVLDIAQQAIVRAQRRCGPQAERIEWIVADVLADPDLGTFDLWHDRAVFHFLTRTEDRARYAAVAARRVAAGGHLLVAAFAEAGPPRCSGLPVRRYDAASLADEFAPALRPLGHEVEMHRTPWGSEQPFVYVMLQRTG